ncbi:MAG: hypothetical protein KGQ88_01380, partial [Chloroflexi bacterium]|nr:hypothetical protein [Chloroflexota bacterium]
MDFLEGLTGSRTRADVLAALFLDEPHPWMVRELGRAANKPHQMAGHEIEWLVECGVLRGRGEGIARSYALEMDDPLVKELGRLVRQSRGRVPDVRR